MNDLIGVKIGEKHSFDDFGLVMSSKTISPPNPKVNKVSIPLRDGAIDLTEALMADVKYEERTITIVFSVIDPVNTWTTKISAIENYCHGQKMKIIFDDDTSFYYIGRIQVNEFTSNKTIGTLVVECTVDPYKYDILATNEPWLWNPFDFENGIINSVANIAVSGTASVVVIGRRKKDYPKISCTTAMQVTFKGITYNLNAGMNTMYDIVFEEGENTLTFTGNGTVTVVYRGASL